MSYQVLARKWRPQQFNTLVGQSHILQALTHALNNQRLHHAYLFTGTRGVGKTTIARIFAKCLNCEKGISANPCGECSTCQAIETGKFVDLLEIDAASKTKVEDTRDLLDNVMYAPTQGRYKVYLIDEVHMLSGHSFNALLKTLEEPPEHVKFLLATTDPQKLPITVLSRCLQFQLQQLSPEQITPHLLHILNAENIPFEASALELLAHAAKGSARDALSLLDQAIATSNNNVTQEIVSQMLGIQGQQLILPLAQHILQQETQQALSITKNLAVLAADFDYVLEQLITLFHDVSIKQLAPEFHINSLIASEAELQKLAQTCDAQDLQLCYQIALLAKRDLALAPSLQIGFEMALLRMIAFKVGQNVQAPIAEPKINTSSAKKSPAELPPWEVTSPSTVEKKQNIETPIATQITEPERFPQNKITVTPENAEWHELLPKLGLTAFAKALAEHLLFERKDNQHYYFRLEDAHAPMLQERHRQKIELALSEYFKQPIQVSIQLGRGEATKMSALEQRQEQTKTKQQEALKSFEEDKTLQKLVTNFDAKVLPESLALKENIEP